RRVVNKPRRNIGRRRLEFLERHAGNHSCTLYEAMRSTLGDEIFRGTKAGQFMQLIEGFSDGYADAPVSEILSSILDKSGYEAMLRLEGSQDRLDNLAELKQSVMDFETSCGEEVTLEHYLSHVALFTNSDAEDRSDKVKLMTVHAAKGLEFPHVFLCGMNEGVFPSRKTKDLPGMEEERRLAFVAMTRAEKRLYLSGAEGWNFDGSYRYPSRFVLDIDRQHLAFTDGMPGGALTSPDNGSMALSNRHLPPGQIFQAGERIRHEHFGEGTIIDVDASRSAYVIQFDAARSMRTIAFKAKIRRA
ncbi:MAG: ATP-binding domain-containing protein, partial [Mailhella sp.]|nr:ATP-binding domain-containing protein [Mailhella sp.]